MGYNGRTNGLAAYGVRSLWGLAGSLERRLSSSDRGRFIALRSPHIGPDGVRNDRKVPERPLPLPLVRL